MTHDFRQNDDERDDKILLKSILYCGIYAFLSSAVYVLFAYGTEVFHTLKDNDQLMKDSKYLAFIIAPVAEYFIFNFLFMKSKHRFVVLPSKMEPTGYVLLLVLSLMLVFYPLCPYAYVSEILISGIILSIAYTKFLYALPIRYALAHELR